MAALSGADLLCLLSDVDGLYTGDPSSGAATHLAQVDEITKDIEDMAGGVGSALAKGGMKTKLMAARTATAAGCAMVISSGQVKYPLTALEQGAKSTLFTASATPAAARKRWIDGMKPKGTVLIDEGAARALRQGNSLLPAGVIEVEGTFLRGDPVDVRLVSGAMVARGLMSYSSDEAVRIAGTRSGDIPAILGYPGRAALVHRDDMAL